MHIDLGLWRSAVRSDKSLGYVAKQVANVLARNTTNGVCSMSCPEIANAAAILNGGRPVRTARHRT
jgi:hypothetical protein